MSYPLFEYGLIYDMWDLIGGWSLSEAKSFVTGSYTPGSWNIPVDPGQPVRIKAGETTKLTITLMDTDYYEPEPW
jgi:hypothetical protein